MGVDRILLCFVTSLTALWLSTAGPGLSQEKDKEALAKAAQNPLSNLITVPFQNNFYFYAKNRIKTANMTILYHKVGEQFSKKQL